MQFDTDIERDGFTLRATIDHDSDYGTPWDDEDGHGPVSDWTKRAKLPGELVLCEDDRGSRRFYDFAEACRMALRDGWGWLPGSLRMERAGDNHQAILVMPDGSEPYHSDWHADINAAMNQVYAWHRATMSARAYASKAALADFNRLRDWCDYRWNYVGVIVTASRAGIELASDSLWGIESDAGDYLATVADECAAIAIDEARAKLAQLAE